MNLKSIGKRVQEKFLGKNEEKTLEEVVKEEVIEPIQDENTELTSSEIATQIIELLNKNPANKRKEIIQELRKSDVISSNKSPTPPEPWSADIAIGSPTAKE